MCKEKDFTLEKVLSNIRLTKDISLIEVSYKGIKPKPGQFFMLKPKHSSVLLPRPISVYDCTDNSVSFIIGKKGKGTEELIESVDDIYLTGPLGSYFSINKETIDMYKSVVLIGGGLGVAPILFLVKELEHVCDIRLGFKDEVFLPFVSSDYMTYTENGSFGIKGTVLYGFKPEEYDGIFACGPEPMLRKLQGMTSVYAEMSLERRMACGVGACLGCTINTTKGNKRVCADGPVFLASEIVF